MLAGPLLALLSSVLWGTSDFVGGLLSRRRAPAAVVGCSHAIGLVVVTGIAVATDAWVEPSGWLLWAIGGAAGGAGGLVLFFAAMARGPMGVVAPVAALGVLVPVGLGLAVGERPSGLQLLGVPIALTGAVAVSRPEFAAGRGGGRAVLFAALAGLGFGWGLWCLARGAQASPIMVLVGMRLSSTAVFVVAAVVLRSLGGIRVADLPVLAVIGTIEIVANMALGFAATTDLVSVTTVLGSQYAAVTVVLARLVLGERLRSIQAAGVVFALTGVALIAAG